MDRKINREVGGRAREPARFSKPRWAPKLPEAIVAPVTSDLLIRERVASGKVERSRLTKVNREETDWVRQDGVPRPERQD